MTLQVVPTSPGSGKFTVLEGSRTLGEIVLHFWPEEGSLIVDGVSYNLYREKPQPCGFILEGRRGAIARAEQPSIFRREFVIRHDGREYTLRPKSAFGRKFILLERGRQVGSITPKSLFTRKAEADLPGELPPRIRLFILWLPLMTEATAAAST
jgi:hypothetical protein